MKCFDMDKLIQAIAAIASAIAAIASVYIAAKAYYNSKQFFILGTVEERSKFVNNIWLERHKSTYGKVVEVMDYKVWSELVTTIVQSLEIIKELTGKSESKYTKFKMAFVQRLDVQVSDTFKNRVNQIGLIQTDDKDAQVFKSQIIYIRKELYEMKK
jgi:hypothetical protein